MTELNFIASHDRTKDEEAKSWPIGNFRFDEKVPSHGSTVFQTPINEPTDGLSNIEQ